ncbi:transporter [Psychroflexus aestuariivivens]|uniref:transporter n=1 Tax=Psychroflexus aestuariivivens TaxID=1795040 RepID=UPI000FD9BEB2|nr:transporter [Psychroflexus aestuariivivens]
MKYITSLLLLFIPLVSQAQYTETINSNRPGESFGAYAVGTNVLQFETGLAYGEDTHSNQLIPNRSQIDFQYQIRYGLYMEKLEVILDGTFASAEEQYLRGGQEITNSYSNLESNTLGAKYLIYDPNIKRIKEGPDLYSWKANNRFQWDDLIPAVSAYAGVNLRFGENPFLYEGESSISPKAAIITQNNWGRWVFVTNLIANQITEEFPTYAGVFTLTHSLYSHTGIFAEFQTYISDIYSDEILRGGVAFLVNDNLQIDASGLFNFKDTPERWRFGVGVSYRIDMHTEDEYILNEEQEEELEKEQEKKEEESDQDFDLPEDEE